MNTQLDRERARAGRNEGVVRYVLTFGLILVVIGFVVAYLWGAFDAPAPG